MHHQAGVQTVAAGGLPSNGPMQTPSGSRGAQAYDFDNLDTDIAIAKETNASAGNFLPERQVDVSISYASFNIRDQVRKGESTPLQFCLRSCQLQDILHQGHSLQLREPVAVRCKRHLDQARVVCSRVDGHCLQW